MSWKSYNLDREAQKLVLIYRDKPGVIGQSHKMRSTVAYGLERFWGEHLRLQSKEPNKAQYWKETWEKLVETMAEAGIPIPNDTVEVNDTKSVQAMAEKLWELKLEDQRITLAVLTQLCDCLVWWTQRYKGTKER